MQRLTAAAISAASAALAARDDPATKHQEQPTFTPRLGRELENELSLYDLVRALLGHVDAQEEQQQQQHRSEKEKEQEQQEQLPQPVFPPRLGRDILMTSRIQRLLRKLQAS